MGQTKYIEADIWDSGSKRLGSDGFDVKSMNHIHFLVKELEIQGKILVEEDSCLGVDVQSNQVIGYCDANKALLNYCIKTD